MSHPIEDLERMLDKLYDMVAEMHNLAQETDDTLDQLRPVVSRERVEDRVSDEYLAALEGDFDDNSRD